MELDPETDLTLDRVLNAPRALVWDCWTRPEHMVHWFVPRPHRVVDCRLDVRTGGACNCTFEVEGQRMENPGVYLEVIEGEKLVFTDTYTEGWKPAPEPFMTAILTFADAGEGRTAYRAVVRHRSPEAKKQHEEMGFHEGWGTVADQLVEYANELGARQMVLSRSFAAAPAQVYAAWTDPVVLPRWFGPLGFDCVTQAIDIREGGEWRFDMAGKGMRFANRHRFTRLEPGRRIEFLLDDGSDDAPPAAVSVRLEPEGTGTRLTQILTFPDAGARAEAEGYNALELGQSTLAKLAAELGEAA